MDGIFLKNIRYILENEGGFIDDPNDLGGETKYGISKKAYPHLDIKKLRIERAREIYYKDYWVKGNCNELPDHLKLMHFDMAVNAGVKTAAMILQKAIGNIKVDGIIGPVTISNSADCSLSSYAVERCLHYAKIVVAKPKQIKFLVGWINRVNKIAKM